jgi:hypothetical protein
MWPHYDACKTRVCIHLKRLLKFRHPPGKGASNSPRAGDRPWTCDRGSSSRMARLFHVRSHALHHQGTTCDEWMMQASDQSIPMSLTLTFFFALRCVSAACMIHLRAISAPCSWPRHFQSSPSCSLPSESTCAHHSAAYGRHRRTGTLDPLVHSTPERTIFAGDSSSFLVTCTLFPRWWQGFTVISSLRVRPCTSCNRRVSCECSCSCSC